MLSNKILELSEKIPSVKRIIKKRQKGRGRKKQFDGLKHYIRKLIRRAPKQQEKVQNPLEEEYDQKKLSYNMEQAETDSTHVSNEELSHCGESLNFANDSMDMSNSFHLFALLHTQPKKPLKILIEEVSEMASSELPSAKKSSLTREPNEKLIENQQNIVDVEFDNATQDLIFSVELPDMEVQKSSKQTISRSELLQQSPLSLLKFYEKHLEFSGNKDLQKFILA